MKRPAIFFDRDNTLIVSDGYLGDPAKVVLVDGAANAIAKARQYGFKVFTFSNQSGVARGMFTEVDVKAVNAKMDEMLKASSAGAIIEGHEYCPFHPEGTIEQYRKESDLRKPAPGMLVKLARQHNVDLARSWVIGDAPRDIEAGKAAGCRTILFTAPGLTPSAAVEEKLAVVPDFLAATLKEAVEIVARNMTLPRRGEGAKAGGNGAAQAAPAPGPVIVIEDPEPVAEIRTESRAAEKPAPRSRTEMLLEQILLELKRKKEAPQSFSIIKMLAGVFQVASISAIFLAFFHRGDASLANYLLFSIALQGVVIAFLIMGKENVS